MRKIVLVMIVVLLLNLSLANAITEQEINEAKSLIDSKTDCKSLSDSQLEVIGEYYMEQMHPGEAHELMHKMMGLEEGSDAEEQFHINMAKTMYCGEGGMMGMMMGGNMMGSGGMTGYGMMGTYPTYYGYNSLLSIFWLVFLVGAIALIIWLIYKFAGKGKESGTPINILQKRYAKGEINKKQFEEMRRELRG